MNEFHPWRSTRPNPWPRRIAYTLLIAGAALLLYAFSAQAGGSPPRPTDKPWPPKTHDYSYVCKHRPEIVNAWRCAKFNSRRPYRP